MSETTEKPPKRTRTAPPTQRAPRQNHGAVLMSLRQHINIKLGILEEIAGENPDARMKGRIEELGAIQAMLNGK